MRSLGLVVLIWAACGVIALTCTDAQADAMRVGETNSPVSCATCHAGVVRSYSVAPMHHAMEPDGANSELIANPDLKASIGAYTYRVETKNGHSTTR